MIVHRLSDWTRLIRSPGSEEINYVLRYDRKKPESWRWHWSRAWEGHAGHRAWNRGARNRNWNWNWNRNWNWNWNWNWIRWLVLWWLCILQAFVQHVPRCLKA